MEALLPGVPGSRLLHQAWGRPREEAAVCHPRSILPAAGGEGAGAPAQEKVDLGGEPRVTH